MTALALDGPLNGAYITDDQAKENDYYLTEWTTGEEVFVHSVSKHLIRDDEESDG